MDPSIPSIGTLLRRGLRQRCPHCGQGALFKRLLELQEFCPVCGIRLEKNPGDTWGLWVAFDRFLIGVPVLLFLIGLMPRERSSFTYWCVGVIAIILLTARNRYGAAVAIDYLSRRKIQDPEDFFPEIPKGKS